MLLNNRHGSVDSDAYRYGFQGQERDDEVKGSGSSYDFGARMYDNRIGRWFTTDNYKKAHLSSYQFASNNPIMRVDPDGNDEITFYFTFARKGDALVAMVNFQIVEDGKDELIFRVISPKDGKIEDIKSVIKSIEGSDLFLISPAVPGTNIANTRKGYEARKRKLPFAEPTNMAGVTIDDYTYLGVLLNQARPLPEQYYESEWGAFLRGAQDIPVSLDVAGYAGFAEIGIGLGLQGGKLLLRKGVGELVPSLADDVTKTVVNGISDDVFGAVLNNSEHIFSARHIKGGIMDLGSSVEDILKNIGEVITRNKSSLKEGSNDIIAMINGHKTTVKAFVREGEVMSANAFKGTSKRVAKSTIDETIKTAANNG